MTSSRQDDGMPSRFDYQAVMSGAESGPIGSLARAGLWLASVPYGAAVSMRNRQFDANRREIHRCGVPVISAGNLTAGGTGKTPLVCLLANWFRERQIRVAILSRGYGRGEQDFNDEAMELHQRLPDVPHLQDPDRVKSATIAVEELESQVLIMDDGFQHRRLHRDLDLVVVDASCPFGHGHLLPRGLLREPVKNVRRADLVVLSRCSTVDEAAIGKIEASIRRYAADLPIVRSDHSPTRLLEHPHHWLPIETLHGARVAAISAIGNPSAFEETVMQCGANLVAHQRLPDHDPFDPATVAELRQWIASLDHEVDRVVCTHKDLVKLRADRLGGKPVAAVMIDLTMQTGAPELERMLEQLTASGVRDEAAEI